MHELIEDTLLSRIGNPVLNDLDDSAVLPDLLGRALEGGRVALTTDSFVVQPLFFPGGDIGKLAVCGTVNDLAMKGALPAYLTLGLIAEEGLPLSDLERALSSLGRTAESAGVRVAAGDTKVVERGAVGGLMLNTAGLGVVPAGRNLGAGNVREGDVVIVSGMIGDHETAILLAREELKVSESIESDCAPLHSLAETVLGACPETRMMRDPTRGGLATTLCEIASSSGLGVTVDEARVPVRESVASVCDILGFDPIYMANEGKAVIVAPPDGAEPIMKALRGHELGRDAALIGEVGGRPGVHMRTRVGGLRPIVMLEGVQLPRIC
ncbi:MAG: hydrogenase expression/formation protein HypE [Candidatus Eisenbacteria bacterium]|nr:hydrogenase expression/formation protein HypE [Candidatus Eisenbacteria bacterium]